MSTMLASARLVAEEISDEATVEEICRFRARVWRDALGGGAELFPEGTWRDEFDAFAQHWVVREIDGRLVGAARLTVHDRLDDVQEAFQYQRYELSLSGRIAAPDRVVVCPTARRRGVAALLLDAQDGAARRRGARCAVRQASPGMSRLVARRGWRLVGPALADRRFPGVAFTVASVHVTHRTTCP